MAIEVTKHGGKGWRATCSMLMGNMEERTMSRPWMSGWLEKIIWEIKL